MILQCPACNARYAVPDHALGAAGRDVRCAKCKHQWHAKPDIADISPEALDLLLSKPSPPKLKPIPKDSNLPKIPAKLTLSPALLGALAASFLLAIFTSLFAYNPGWFGMHSTKNIVFSDLKIASQKVDSNMEYGISGKLVNLADTTTALPSIRITLVDKAGTPLKTWLPDGVDSLAPKEVRDFNFAPLSTALQTGDRLVLELGNGFELALRGKP